jgi:ubiquitin-conjugating enzyme E2 D/E
MAAARLRREIGHIDDIKYEMFTYGPLDGDIFNWTATITGQAGTKLTGLRFELELTFNDRYPFHAPKVRFRQTRNHTTICTDILADAWSPALSIDKLLLSICSLLMEGTRFDAEKVAVYSPDRVSA